VDLHERGPGSAEECKRPVHRLVGMDGALVRAAQEAEMKAGVDVVVGRVVGRVGGDAVPIERLLDVLLPDAQDDGSGQNRRVGNGRGMIPDPLALFGICRKDVVGASAAGPARDKDFRFLTSSRSTALWLNPSTIRMMARYGFANAACAGNGGDKTKRKKASQPCRLQSSHTPPCPDSEYDQAGRFIPAFR
jgi:hypothetical protein